MVLDGDAAALRENEDVKEFYLGIGGDGRRSFRDTRPVQSADGDLKLNRALWHLANEFAKLKGAKAA